MGKLYMLDYSALSELKMDVSYGIDKYKEPSSFLEDKFKEKQYRTEIGIEIDLPDLITYQKSSEAPKMWEQDFQNSILLHSKINSNTIPLKYLVDERFWTYLTHTHFWSYLQKRWPADNENRVLEKWFFRGSNEVFSRHSLVRLWWIAECSYDPNSSDPYELTKIAFEITDPFNQVLERKFSKSRKIFRSVLLALKNDRDKSKALTKAENRTKLGRTINTMGGVKFLDSYDESELVQLFNDMIDSIVKGD